MVNYDRRDAEEPPSPPPQRPRYGRRRGPHSARARRLRRHPPRTTQDPAQPRRGRRSSERTRRPRKRHTPGGHQGRRRARAAGNRPPRPRPSRRPRRDRPLHRPRTRRARHRPPTNARTRRRLRRPHRRRALGRGADYSRNPLRRRAGELLSADKQPSGLEAKAVQAVTEAASGSAATTRRSSTAERGGSEVAAHEAFIPFAYRVKLEQAGWERSRSFALTGRVALARCCAMRLDGRSSARALRERPPPFEGTFSSGPDPRKTSDAATRLGT